MENPFLVKLAQILIKQQQYNAALPHDPYSLKTAKTPAEILGSPEYQSHLKNMIYGKEDDGK